MEKAIRLAVLLITLLVLAACKQNGEKQQNTITFNSNGGTPVTSITEYSGTIINEPNKPTKENYDFDGWLYNGVIVTWPYTINSNVTFEAVWSEKLQTENEYLVTFYTNGGSDIDSIKVRKGHTISKPNDPKRSEYIFKGWFLNQSLKDEVSWPLVVNSNVSLYAKWVSLNLELTLEGTTLKWNNEEGLPTEIYVSNELFSTTNNQFEIPQKYQDGNNHNIKVILDGGKSDYVFYQKLTEEMTNAPLDLIVDGNLLKWNWFGNEFRSNGFAIYIDGELEQDRFSPQFNLATLTSDLFESKTFDIVIFAKGNEHYNDSKAVCYTYTYEVIDYEVTLNYKDDNNKIENFQTIQGLINLPNPERTGYQFNGWYLSFDGGNNLTQQWTSDKKVMNDIVLYASWVENVSGGGREALATPQVSTAGYGFIWNVVARSNGYEYRIKYESFDQYSDWKITYDNYIYAEGNYTAIQIKAKGDGNTTIDSAVVTRTWNKANYSIIGNIKIHYDVGAFYWDSTEEEFNIELYSRITNELIDEQTSFHPEYIIPSYLSAGEYRLVVNGISRNISYQMLAAPELIDITAVDEGLKIVWNRIDNADSYRVNINDAYTFNQYSPLTQMIIPISYLIRNQQIKISIKAECLATDILNSFIEVYYFDDMVKALIESDNDEIINPIYIPRLSVLSKDLLPILNKDGHRFVGWYLDKDFINLFDYQKIDKDITLYARWQEWESPLYMVSFETNGGEAISPIMCDYNDNLILPIPTKEDHTFNGWYLEKNLETLVDTIMIIEEDVTLYAKWIEGIWYFYETSTGVKIVGLQHSQKVITIPEEYKGLKIDTIGERVLKDNSEIEGVIINTNITQIERNAFGSNKINIFVYMAKKPSSWSTGWSNSNQNVYWSSVGLISNDTYEFVIDNNNTTVRLKQYFGKEESLILPNVIENYNVTSILANAFKDATNLKALIIPNTIELIEESAFSGVTNLEKITLPFLGASKASKGTNAYFRYIFGKEEFIGSYAIDGYHLPSSLRDIILTDATTVVKYAFRNVKSATNIIIPNSVVSIEESIFVGTSKLQSITVPFIGNSIEPLSENAYLGYLFGKFSYEESYRAGMYYFPDSLTDVIITNGKSIGQNAFYGTKSIINIVLPNTLLNIGKSAFKGATGIKNIIIPEKVYAIGESAFEDATSLTNIDISRSVTTIGKSAFKGCSSLTSIIIPNTVAAIGESAFANTSSLRTVEFENNAKIMRIEAYTFENAEALTDINLPDSINYIGSYAFSFASSLENIVIPKNVVEIGGSTFKGVKNLKSITLPYVGGPHKSAVSTTGFGYIFGKDAYNGASQYNGYWIPATLKEVIVTNTYSIGADAFKGIISLRRVVLPENLTSIGDSAFSGCRFLINIVIPTKVITVGKDAFSNCINLTIFAERESEPYYWQSVSWNPSNRPVYWSAEWEYDADNNPIVIEE